MRWFLFLLNAAKTVIFKVVTPLTIRHQVRRKYLVEMESRLSGVSSNQPRPSNRKSIAYAYRHRKHISCEATKSKIIGANEYNKRNKLNHYCNKDELLEIRDAIRNEILETEL